MNLINLFTREEPIAGLEINDGFVRIALLEVKKDKPGLGIKMLEEAELENGALTNGVIQNKASFSKSLQNLIKKLPLKIRYVVVSLPGDNIYSRVFSFPATVSGERLEQTMKLTIGFQLPVKPEDVYLDWEKIENEEQNEILLASIPKPIINAYVDALTSVGLKPIAIEFHPLSLSRVIETEKDKPVLIKIKNKTSTALYILKNQVTRFVRVIDEKFLPEKAIKSEIEKITNFYEAEQGQGVEILELQKAKINDTVPVQIAKDEPWQWFVSVGAALRGLMPRAEDTLVSLLPVGTEETYEYQKATIFGEFLSNVIVGLSIFFIAIFVGAWILMSVLEQRTLKEVETQNLLPLPANAVELENRAIEFNRLVGSAQVIIKTIPHWSMVMKELKAKAQSGITITNATLPAPESVMSVTGIAQNRTQLNLFKKALEESQLFSEVRLPLTNIEQKENIPFSISFQIKDPSKLYETNN